MGTRDAPIVPGVSLLVDHLSRWSWDMCAHGYVYTHLYLFLYLSAYTYQKQLAHTDTASFTPTPRVYSSLFLLFGNVPLQKGEIWFPLSAIYFLTSSILEYT